MIYHTRSGAPINIRPMKTKDLTRVVKIDEASFTSPWSRVMYSIDIKNKPDTQANVAETCPATPDEAPLIVGMVVAYFVAGDEVHIATIAVDAPFRRQGIAEILMYDVLNMFAERGAQTSMLEVRVSNQAAQALYQKFGYEVVGERPNYYSDNHETALLMTAFHVPETLQKLKTIISQPASPQGGE